MPTRFAQRLERVELFDSVCLNRQTKLVNRQVRLSVQFHNPATARFPFVHHLLPDKRRMQLKTP
jgi:hypothetical protein